MCYNLFSTFYERNNVKNIVQKTANLKFLREFMDII